PTIMELIAPKGFEYYSIKPSLLEPIDHIVTPYSWMTREIIGDYKDRLREQLAESAEPVRTETGVEEYAEERSALQDITGWLFRHPELIQ
ncbi:MAG: LTA synthase family protein, partial [Anaerovibrio sp.]|nr:LTA synthase family protein [Anaerovibrio sp.]